MWAVDSYRRVAPVESRLPVILAHIDRVGGVKSVLDIGTGTGRGALVLHNEGLKVTPVDIAENCLDPDVAEVLGDRLTIWNVWDETAPLPGRFDFGVCVDVLEHLPPECIDAALSNIKATCKHGVLIPACFPSGFNHHSGPLHLTVESPAWWADKFEQVFPGVTWVLESGYCVARF